MINTATPTDNGFEYQKKSKAYRQKKKGQIQILKRVPTSEEFSGDKQEDNTITPQVTIPIDPASISILIGSKGRNISIVCRMAYVMSAVENNSHVVFISKSDQSDLDLAHRLMLSMISGGVLRWFNHPAATNKYFHLSVRKELQDYVEATSECTLDLIRAYNGHLCLMLVPKPDANKQFVTEQIKNLRPILLEKINTYALSSHDT